MRRLFCLFKDGSTSSYPENQDTPKWEAKTNPPRSTFNCGADHKELGLRRKDPRRSVAHHPYADDPVAIVKNAAISAETDTRLFATCMITPAHSER